MGDVNHPERRRRALALAAFLAAACLCGSAAAKPARIVSTNLCTDQLALLLAEPSRIASLSYLSADPRSSAMAREARRFPLNHGLAEEILPLAPDLILAGVFTARPTVFLLRRLGYRVVEVPIASTLDDVRANVRRVAAAVGEPARGEAVVAGFDARLAEIPKPGPGRRPVAAVLGPNRYTFGRGTLADAVIEAAGFENLAARLGVTGTAPIPLETLLMRRPDVLVRSRARGEAPALATRVLGHPALARAFAGLPSITVRDDLWVCGTPVVAEAVRRLAAARARLRTWAPKGERP